MKLRTVIYSLLLATLCMGCGGNLSMRQLEQLEARMNDAPDSLLMRYPIDVLPQNAATYGIIAHY